MSNILDKIKLSGTTYDIVDSTAVHSLDGYYTSGQTNDAITAATSALAQTIAEQGYQTSGDVQSAISGKVDNDTYTAYTASTASELSGKASTGDVATLFGAAAYDSDTQRINFYHESTTGAVLTYIDASDFVKDGFLDSVDIEDVEISGETVSCLVFKWNTDAGITETDIPLSDVFNPDNYYDKTATDAAISAATSGLQETLSAGTGIDITSNVISVTGVPLTLDDNVTSGSSNPVKSSGIYSFVTGETATKQDTLVSQTNIKSINGNSILGSGDLTVSTLNAEVSGTTLIFS